MSRDDYFNKKSQYYPIGNYSYGREITFTLISIH